MRAIGRHPLVRVPGGGRRENELVTPKFVAGIGGTWDSGSVQYGDREFVGA